MKIILADLVGKTTQLNCESCEPPQVEGILQRVPQAELQVDTKGKGKYLLSGTLDAVMSSRCDRCGKSITMELNRAFKYTLVVGSEPELGTDYQCSEEDCQTLYLKEAAIDPEVLLAEQLVLAMPLQRLCSKSCEGLCPECGININEDTCQCGGIKKDSPFAVLRSLQQK